VRPKGVGYDSEASDTEIDPAIEEQFILRMQPGEDCDYLRKAIEEKRFGPRSQGGADVSIKSLTRDGRRAIVTIQGRLYAASLVDLPCIIEGMKSWDKRGWYKSADICQMLLVLGRINSEDEAHNHPLPKDVDEKTWQFAHGLTPPMRWVRKRRFRERISNRTIEAVELEVARLIQQDEEAIEPPEFEVLDYAQYNGEASMQRSEEGDYMGYDDEQDAEGEAEYDYDQSMQAQEGGDDFEDALAAEMEAALAADADMEVEAEAEAGGDAPAVPVPMEGEVDAEAEIEAATPITKPSTAGETSGDESDESSQASDADEEMDEDVLEQQRQLQQQREEIAELESLIQAETVKWEQMTNPILKSKLGKRVQSLKQALELKRVSIGEGDADA
jgi:transcription initiation factor TFIID subunit 7